MDEEVICKLYKGARELISDRSHWTQGQYVEAPSGESRDWYQADADCKFCAVGALYVAAHRMGLHDHDEDGGFDLHPIVTDASDKLNIRSFALYNSGVVDVNDGRNPVTRGRPDAAYQAVIDLYDSVLADCKQQGAAQ